MIINEKVIYHSSLDDLYHIKGDIQTFDNKDSAIWYAETDQVLTQQEVKIAMSRQEFAKDVVSHVQGLTPVMDKAVDLEAEYNHLGGESAFSDEDVMALGITKAQFIACITLLQQIENFYGNAAVTQGDYRATVNGVRRAGTT